MKRYSVLLITTLLLCCNGFATDLQHAIELQLQANEELSHSENQLIFRSKRKKCVCKNPGGGEYIFTSTKSTCCQGISNTLCTWNGKKCLK